MPVDITDDALDALEKAPDAERVRFFKSISQADRDAIGSAVALRRMKASQPGMAESALKGAEQGLTFGFADELGGAIQGGLQKVANALPEGALDWAGIDNRYQQDAGDVYASARDENRKKYDEAQRANPGAYMAGEVAGTVLGSRYLPGGKGLAGAVKAGAIAGGVGGLGYSDADVAEKGEFGKALLDTSIGAMTGGAGGALGHAVSARLQPMLSRFGARRAIKATGAIQGDIRGLAKNPERLEEMGRQLVDRGVVTPFAGKEAIFHRADDALQATGGAIGDILDQADELAARSGDASGVRFDWGSTVDRLAKESQRYGKAGQAMAPELNDIAYRAAEMSRNGAGFRDAHGLKQLLGDDINWKATPQEEGIANKFKKRLYGIIKEELESQIDQQLGPQLGDEFRQAHSLHQALLLGRQGGQRGMERELGNRFLSPTDYGAMAFSGGAGGALGAGVGIAQGEDAEGILGRAGAGLAAGVAHKFVRERASSALATTAINASRSQALRQALAKSPAVFGRFAQSLVDAARKGDQEFAVTDFVLSQQSPEYRQAKEKALAESP